MEEKEETLKYNCQKCNYHTNHTASWKNHINTILHKTGKRKTRSDKKDMVKCSHCEYKSSTKTNLKQHILNEHRTKEERKIGFKYYCKYCDYGTFAKTFYDLHLNTAKHINFIDVAEVKESALSSN